MIAKQRLSSVFYLILLILAGEAVFVLPFVLQRVFRPTFLEVFDINNTEIGTCFSIYGIVALFSYLFGGPLADKFKPHHLMSVALILTACGGFYLASYPPLYGLFFLYGFWGFTTIFLFWAALIKATRIWGGEKRQGMAFGFLDGGRGLVAALIGTLGVIIFTFFMDDDISNSSLIERKTAFQQVIYWSSFFVAFTGVLVFLFMKTKNTKTETITHQLKWSDVKALLKLPSVWLLSLIILCAYVGYKTTDLFSLYASTAMNYDDIKAAKVGAGLLYLRPLVGVVIGLLADRSRASIWLIVGFILAAMSSMILGFGTITEGHTWLFIINTVMIATGVYACRVLYFATLEEANIPLALTGTTVGLVSVLGYTPEIFSGPMFGVLLDQKDKVLGLQHAFLVLALFSIIGLLTSIVFLILNRKTSNP